MSIVVTSSIKSNGIGGMISYLFLGRGEQRRQHLENNSLRTNIVSCDTATIKDFAAAAKQVQKKVALISIVQSFSKKEFSCKNKDDLRAVNALGYQLAHRLFPNCICLVVTHMDSAGQNPHNHIIIINKNFENNKALEQNRSVFAMRHINDQLMRENGLSTIAPGKEIVLGIQTRKNFKQHGKNWCLAHDFAVKLQQKIINVQNLQPSSLNVALDLLAREGIEVKERILSVGVGSSKTARESIGLVYYIKDTGTDKMQVDELGRPKPRIRRAKASRLGSRFCFDYWQNIFNQQRENREEKRENREEKGKHFYSTTEEKNELSRYIYPGQSEMARALDTLDYAAAPTANNITSRSSNSDNSSPQSMKKRDASINEKGQDLPKAHDYSDDKGQDLPKGILPGATDNLTDDKGQDLPRYEGPDI